MSRVSQHAYHTFLLPEPVTAPTRESDYAEFASYLDEVRGERDWLSSYYEADRQRLDDGDDYAIAA